MTLTCHAELFGSVAKVSVYVFQRNGKVLHSGPEMSHEIASVSPGDSGNNYTCSVSKEFQGQLHSSPPSDILNIEVVGNEYLTSVVSCKDYDDNGKKEIRVSCKSCQ